MKRTSSLRYCRRSTSFVCNFSVYRKTITKPAIQSAAMDKWKKIQTEIGIFIVRFDLKRKEDSLESLTCWLSDFQHIWRETISNKLDFLNRFQKQNILLKANEIENEICEILLTLPEPKSGSVELAEDQLKLIKDNESIQLNLKYYLHGKIPLKFDWQLLPMDGVCFYREVTLPMIRQLSELEVIRAKLVETVRKKDIEIEQYKLSGATPLIRKQCVTETFDENEVKVSNEMFDCSTGDFASLFSILNSSNESTVALVSSKNAAKRRKGKKNYLLQDYYKPVPKMEYKNVDSPEFLDEEEATAGSTSTQVESQDEITFSKKQKRINLNL